MTDWLSGSASTIAWLWCVAHTAASLKCVHGIASVFVLGAGACVSTERECVYVWVPYAMRCMSCELFSRFVFALIYAHLTQTHSKNCIRSLKRSFAVLCWIAMRIHSGPEILVAFTLCFFSFFSFYLIRFRWLPVLHTQVYITRVSSYVMAVLMCCIPNKIFRQVYLESV